MKSMLAKNKKNGLRLCFFLLAAAAAFFLPPVQSPGADDNFLISLPSKDDDKAADQDESTRQPAVQQEDMLQGAFYDLTHVKETKRAELMSVVRSDMAPDPRSALCHFVLGDWKRAVDTRGCPHYTDLEQYTGLSEPLYRSSFYQLPVPASTAARMIHPRSNSSNPRMDTWVAVYSGYVVAPFTGVFRFAGFGEDGLVVRFNRQIVLDYGVYSLSLGTRFDTIENYQSAFGGGSQTSDVRKMIRSNPLYSKYKMEFAFTDYFNGHGIAKGLPISVKKGQVIPIDILVANIDNNSSSVVLMIEMLDSKGNPLKNAPDRLPLFRTSESIPDESFGSDIPEYDPDSPIWKIVDSKGKPIPERRNKDAYNDGRATARDAMLERERSNANSPIVSRYNSASSKKNMIQGVFYDLKLNQDGKPITYNDSAKDVLQKEIQPLLNGAWKKKINAKTGDIQFVDLEKFYASPAQLLTSRFFVDKEIRAADVPAMFLCGTEVKPSAWVCIFSGYVVAPFTGKFRFVGTCDDALLIRFNKQIVFDYGKVTFSGTSKYYTGIRKTGSGAELGQGLPVDVKKGEIYPIEIMFSDLGGTFSLGIFYERMNAKGEPAKKNPVELPLFPQFIPVDQRSSNNFFFPIDRGGSSWKFVDATGK